MQHGQRSPGKFEKQLFFKTHSLHYIDDTMNSTQLHSLILLDCIQPWFLDGNLVSNFRNKPHIDGSFLSNENHYIPDKETMNENIITLDWTKDPIMKAKSSDFVSVTSKEGIWSMVDQGRSFAKQMERIDVALNLFE